MGMATTDRGVNLDKMSNFACGMNGRALASIQTVIVCV